MVPLIDIVWVLAWYALALPECVTFVRFVTHRNTLCVVLIELIDSTLTACILGLFSLNGKILTLTQRWLLLRSYLHIRGQRLCLHLVLKNFQPLELLRKDAVWLRLNFLPFLLFFFNDVVVGVLLLN